MSNSCKLVYQQETYSIIYNDAEYTLNIIEEDDWVDYSLTDSDGNKVDDDELYDDLMELYHNRN
jgi:ribonuclease HI